MITTINEIKKKNTRLFWISVTSLHFPFLLDKIHRLSEIYLTSKNGGFGLPIFEIASCQYT